MQKQNFDPSVGAETSADNRYDLWLKDEANRRSTIRALRQLRPAMIAADPELIRRWEWAGRNFPRTQVLVVQSLFERQFQDTPVNALAIASDCASLLMNGQDRCATRLNTDDGLAYAQLAAHQAPVNSIRFNLSGVQAITGGMDLSAVVWRIDRPDPIAVLGPFPDVVADAYLTVDGKQALILTAGLLTPIDRQLLLWDVAINRPIKTYGPFADLLTAAALGRYDDCVAVGDTAGRVRIFDLWDETVQFDDHSHQGMITSLSLDTGAPQNLLSADEHGRVLLHRLRLGTTEPLVAHASAINHALLSADAKWAALGAESGLVELWDTRTGSQVFAHPGDGAAVTGLAMCLDRYRMAAGYANGVVRVWRIVYDLDESPRS